MIYLTLLFPIIKIFLNEDYMGFLSGSASYVKFSVEGELPPNPLEYIGDRITSFSFEDIDESYDEYSIGWVSVANMFDASFRYASYLNGDYITLTMRVDERKISAAVLKKYVQKEEERIKEEKQIPKISRAKKVEIKERVRTELMRKSIPVPSVYDICWNLSDSTVLFFTTNKKAQGVFEDFFKESFGLMLRQQIPYVVGEHVLDDEGVGRLSEIRPEILL